MTDLRKAAEMALEAMKDTHRFVRHYVVGKETERIATAFEDAMKALRQALAQSEQEKGSTLCDADPRLLLGRSNNFTKETKNRLCDIERRLASIETQSTLSQPKQEPVSDRENAIIRFAVHQFMTNAYLHLSAAAQDKDHRRYSPESTDKFAKDARDAEVLLKRLQFTAPPKREWVGLTRKDVISIVVMHAGHPTKQIEATEAMLKEKNT